MSLGTRVAYATHRGRRPSNQDVVVARQLADGRELVAVADGMGGHAAGEVASARAVEVMVEELERGAELREAIVAANAAVHRESLDTPEWAGMGTTVVAALRTGGTYQIAGVGDSRAYRVAAGGIQQITRDHTFEAEALRVGNMTAEELRASPWRESLTRVIGADPEVEVDVFGPFDASSDPHTLLLCSDGVYRPLREREIQNGVLPFEDLQEAVDVLIDTALRQGSTDNVTAALIRVGDRPTQDAATAGAAARAHPAASRSTRPAPPRHVRRAPDLGRISDWTFTSTVLVLLACLVWAMVRLS